MLHIKADTPKTATAQITSKMAIYMLTSGVSATHRKPARETDWRFVRVSVWLLLFKHLAKGSIWLMCMLFQIKPHLVSRLLPIFCNRLRVPKLLAIVCFQ